MTDLTLISMLPTLVEERIVGRATSPSSTSIKLAESQKHERLTKVADLLEENASEPHFLLKNPKGQKIAPYLRKLGDQMGESQSLILEELKALSNHVDHIKHILKTLQEHCKNTLEILT